MKSGCELGIYIERTLARWEGTGTEKKAPPPPPKGSGKGRSRRSRPTICSTAPREKESTRSNILTRDQGAVHHVKGQVLVRHSRHTDFPHFIGFVRRFDIAAF